MFNATRLAATVRYAAAFVLHFAHGGLVVAGLIVITLVGMRVADHGWTGLQLPGVFGSQTAAAGDGVVLTEADLERTDAVAADDAVVAFTPDMARVTDYLARRYKVSRAAIEPVVQSAHKAGQAVGLDPLLLIAVMGIESSFNPFAESPFGAQGLMQVVPRFHQDKIDPQAGAHALLDPAENIRVGAMVLKEYIRRNGSLVAGLQQYAGAADDPATGYANKVMAEKQRLSGLVQSRARLAAAN